MAAESLQGALSAATVPSPKALRNFPFYLQVGTILPCALPPRLAINFSLCQAPLQVTSSQRVLDLHVLSS